MLFRLGLFEFVNVDLKSPGKFFDFGNFFSKLSMALYFSMLLAFVIKNYSIIDYIYEFKAIDKIIDETFLGVYEYFL